jgi:segregation and condensation protein B
MARDESTGSLADEAAAWVPPWSRQPEQVAPEPLAPEPPAVEPPAVEPPAVEAPAVEAPQAVEALAPDEPLEPLPPDEPVEPGEPLPPAEPLEPLPPGEPLEPLEPLEPFEPTDPLLPGDPLATSTDGSVASEAAQTSSDQSSQLAAIPTTEIKGALEAILLVVDEPVSEIMLAQIIEQPTERIVATLAELAAEYDEQERGFELRAIAGGWRFYTRTAYASYVERFVLDGQQVRLTQAALETLAVIAYKQPVTRSRISAIRGVNCDGVVRTLLSRGLIEECGSEPDSGAHLYRTTTLFLEKLGLNSVEQLPPLAPFLPDDVEALADASS